MKLRIVLAVGAAALAVATPAAAYEPTTFEIAEHSALTGASTSIVPPTRSIALPGRPVTTTQAIAKAVPSAYGTVTSYRSCAVEAAGDVAFITITECSVTTNTLAYDNDGATGFVNAAATAANVTLPGRRITVCVNALVTPRAGSSFYTGRACGISV